MNYDSIINLLSTIDNHLIGINIILTFILVIISIVGGAVFVKICKSYINK